MPAVSARVGQLFLSLDRSFFQALGYVLYLQYKLWARGFHVVPLGSGAYVEIASGSVGDGAGSVFAPEVCFGVDGCGRSWGVWLKSQ